MLLVSPVSVVEWLVPPVVVKAVMEAKATPAVFAQLQVAVSLVVTVRVVCVVPEVRVPEGAEMVMTGGVVSTTPPAWVVAEAEVDCAELFPAASKAETVYE